MSYDDNGADSGSAPVDGTAYIKGETAKVLDAELSLEGHRFMAWNTAADGSGSDLSPGDSLSIGTTNITLYAQYDWLYEISFDGNEANSGIPPATIYVVAEEYFTIDATTDLEKLGYTFANWNTDASGGGQDYTAGESYTTTSDLTLYAQWTAIDYTLSYDPNGADGGDVPDAVTVWGSDGGNPITVSGNDNNLAREGMVWDGWNTNANGDGDNYRENEEIAMDYSDQILYASWERSVSQVSVGYYHTIILKSDNSLWATGNNEYGQLGDDSTSDRYSPVEIDVTGDVEAVSAGYSHTMILKSDGSLWATGWNLSGQLGDDSTNDRDTPVAVVDMTSGVAAVSAGGAHTMILKSDDSLWATGLNLWGQFGGGTRSDRTTPVLVNATGDVKAVSAGYSHTMILKSDDSLWATGWNYGQLGFSETIDYILVPEQVMGDVDAVSAKQYHTMILKSDGGLWATGRNLYGQLGDDSTSDRYTPVSVIPLIKSD